ncbi:GlxA family transcriptional regulator [Nocardia arthritidis]|uniref:Helix-turn-helix domain-containing protein n=1 Tax=Nocardia arthritidis TaxID=228602 RepID=A0A6G9YU79_9NOCA|nr:GlxA family transcriptional regulator [Nocardia arthritidis]QIS16762.1 helix-turn-helix domain-containing protein [Nocardia arthritidis]
MESEKQIVAVVFDDCTLLDLAGPTDVFRAASMLNRSGGYRLTLVSPDGRAIRASSGIGIAVDAAMDAELVGPDDTVLVVGGSGIRQLTQNPAALRALRRMSARAGRTASVCTGALALAAAGLLDGRRATTHWASCGLLRDGFPLVRVEPDQIYVRDGDRWTSAGVSAGIDLALALVEADHGTELAHAVAAWLVVFARRPGGQAQFSVQLRNQPGRTPAIVELQHWLPDHLTDDLSVAALADRAGMSPRNFARVFRAEVGVTPGTLVEGLRIEAAKRLLTTSDLPVSVIAARTGFGRPETLHRAFARRVGTTPHRYRDHFTRRIS